ncbi:hypothetical protein KAX75_12010 [candidate division WOR-3 bacterium]|nr:hypothetical protein [candidate division WOR-3 bacterium]
MTKRLFYSMIVFVSIIVIILAVDLSLFLRLKRKKTKRNIHTEEMKSESLLSKRNSFRYKPSFKDPFLPFNFQGDTAKLDSVKKEEILTLKGVVLGPGEPVAVIEDKYGNVSILKKGESFNDLKVISVKKDRVKVKYKKESYKLEVWKE